MCVVGWDDPGVQKALSLTFLSNRKKERGRGRWGGKKKDKRKPQQKKLLSNLEFFTFHSHI